MLSQSWIEFKMAPIKIGVFFTVVLVLNFHWAHSQYFGGYGVCDHNNDLNTILPFLLIALCGRGGYGSYGGGVGGYGGYGGGFGGYAPIPYGGHGGCGGGCGGCGGSCGGCGGGCGGCGGCSGGCGC